MKRIFTSVLTGVFLLVAAQSNACTTAVISGKYTADGKPMLWKLRDTDFLSNAIKHYSSGKYSFIGLINSEDKGAQVWAGMNEAGFAIMNAASFNVNEGYQGEKIDQEGLIMRRALAQCANLDDFFNFLQKLDPPRGLATSFGVIDAKGGAAYFEVDNENITRFDANDARFAPHGYILRTNYSFTGKKDQGYGYIRYQSAQELFKQADATGNLNFRTIIQDFSRSFYHSLLKTDYETLGKELSSKPYFINSGDLMTRHGTSSAVLIQGVQQNQAPQLTTMWSLVGFPHTTVTVPLWVSKKGDLPKWTTLNEQDYAPICQKALELKEQCYPIERSSGYKYMNLSALINREDSGISQKLRPLENIFIARAEQLLEKWQHEGVDDKEINEYYQWVDLQLATFFSE
ncbi:MAG: carcinine hydrolase/isopenicillin-N N-acyltransferase family protein [Bacteroidota bacterium]